MRSTCTRLNELHEKDIIEVYMTDTKFNEVYENYLAIINKSLSESINSINNDGVVKNAMRYSLESGGKRIRPIFLMEFFRVYSSVGFFDADTLKKAVPSAVAIEAIHSFSLIHDDLPCMDNDDMRRGKPSCHKMFSESTALLAGDALSFFALEMIVRTFLPGKEQCYKKRLCVVNEICKASGVSGMIGGQQLDMEFEKNIPSEKELTSMYKMKTAALLKAACRSGCILAGAEEEAIENAGNYAEKLGLAFQITDDILDITGDEKKLGKPIGSDKEQGKATYASVFGIDSAVKKAKQYTDEAVYCLSKVPDNKFLKNFTDKLLNRNN